MNRQAIFLSYSRSDAKEFIDRLTRDLTRHGHRVWMDARSIETSARFDVEIEAAIQRSQIFVAVMSLGSLHENSVCRDEIVFALNKDKKLLPVKLHNDITPSLLLARRQWLDFSLSYSCGLDSLLNYLNGTSDCLLDPATKLVEGRQPIDFSPELARYTEGFVGREWFKNAVEDLLLNSDDTKSLVLVAEPGFGKSAIAAFLTVQFSRQLIGIHFCTRRKTSTIRPADFVASLVGQLENSLPQFSHALARQNSGERHNDASDAFRELVVEVLRGINPPPSTRLIVIDGLDEADLNEGQTIADILGRHSKDLPQWIKLILTTRPEAPVIRQLRHLDLCFLDPSDSGNRKDLKCYIKNRIDTIPLSIIPQEDRQSATRRLLNLATGNFEYARQVCDAIAQKRLDISELGSLVPGLDPIYNKLFSRYFATVQAWEHLGRPLMRVFAVARDPLELEMLVKLTGIDAEELVPLLGRLGSCLRADCTNTYRTWTLFHKSLQDWLLDPALSSDFYCDATVAHQSLVVKLWGSRSYDPYAAAHLVSHAAFGQLSAEFTELLCDSTFRAQFTDKMGSRDMAGRKIGHLAKEVLNASTVKAIASDALVSLSNASTHEIIEVGEIFFASGHWPFLKVADQLWLRICDDALGPIQKLSWAIALFQGMDEWDRAGELAKVARQEFIDANDSLGEALASAQIASIYFDSSDDLSPKTPETLLRTSCMPTFSTNRMDLEYALACETLAIIVDAEGRWAESLSLFDECVDYYRREGNLSALSRLSFNRSVALLFASGIDASLEEFRVSLKLAEEAPFEPQRKDYLRALDVFYSIFQKRQLASSQLAPSDGSELWIRLIHQSTASLWKWMRGDQTALCEMTDVLEQWKTLGDKWGAVDAKINIALMQIDFQVNTGLSISTLQSCYEQCKAMNYPVGAAICSNALGRASPSCVAADEREFYEAYLSHLFVTKRSQFVPTYALNMPSFTPRLRGHSANY